MARSADGLLVRVSESEGSGLGEAQERKLDRICRKLRLEKGQRFLDLGCGWAGFSYSPAAITE